MTLAMRRSPTDIRTLARDIVTNRKYLAITPEALECSFGLILMALTAEGHMTEVEAAKIGAVVGDYEKTFDRAINGYPMFYAAEFVHINDMPYLERNIQQMAKALT